MWAAAQQELATLNKRVDQARERVSQTGQHQAARASKTRSTVRRTVCRRGSGHKHRRARPEALTKLAGWLI